VACRGWVHSRMGMFPRGEEVDGFAPAGGPAGGGAWSGLGSGWTPPVTGGVQRGGGSRDRVAKEPAGEAQMRPGHSRVVPPAGCTRGRLLLSGSAPFQLAPTVFGAATDSAKSCAVSVYDGRHPCGGGEGHIA
jgi:hypothetical protein